MNKILTACLVAVLCQSAFANDGRWFYMGTSGEIKVYINTEQSTSENVWMKFIYRKPVQNIAHSIKQYSINCQQNSHALMQEINYDKNGNPVHHNQQSNNIKYNQSVPDTLGEAIIHFACSEIPMERAKATAEINLWSLKMQQEQPAEYAKFEPNLKEFIQNTLPKLPPQEWAEAVKQEYLILQILASRPTDAVNTGRRLIP